MDSGAGRSRPEISPPGPNSCKWRTIRSAHPCGRRPVVCRPKTIERADSWKKNHPLAFRRIRVLVLQGILAPGAANLRRARQSGRQLDGHGLLRRRAVRAGEKRFLAALPASGQWAGTRWWPTKLTRHRSESDTHHFANSLETFWGPSAFRSSQKRGAKSNYLPPAPFLALGGFGPQRLAKGCSKGKFRLQ